jgi:hypothetical protein
MEKPTDTNDPQQPYPNDPFATPDDPTPGGPMTGGVLPCATSAMRAVDTMISMTEIGHEAFNAAWENLSFSTALDHAKAGVAIARKGWPKDCEGGLLLRDGKFFGAPVLEFIKTGQGPLVAMCTGLPTHDIIANDWYVLP